MKTSLSLLTAGILSAFSANASDLVISGVIDGPLTGGIPKAVELYVVNDIADLSVYGIGTANNGGGTDGVEFTFPADSASAGSYIYVASEIDGFTTFLVAPQIMIQVQWALMVTMPLNCSKMMLL